MARILLIDDDEIIRRTLSALLSRRGHAVSAFEDGAPALSNFEPERFDLVLTDLSMPTGGDEVVRQIREKGYEGPIAMMTGSASLYEEVTIKQLPIDALLRKPFTAGELSVTIDSLLAAAADKRQPCECE